MCGFIQQAVEQKLNTLEINFVHKTVSYERNLAEVIEGNEQTCPSMGMGFLWESNGKRPMEWDGTGMNCYGMGMGQINMSHGQPWKRAFFGWGIFGQLNGNFTINPSIVQRLQNTFLLVSYNILPNLKWKY